ERQLDGSQLRRATVTQTEVDPRNGAISTHLSPGILKKFALAARHFGDLGWESAHWRPGGKSTEVLPFKRLRRRSRLLRSATGPIRGMRRCDHFFRFCTSPRSLPSSE